MLSILPQNGSIFGDVCVIKITDNYTEKLSISTQIAICRIKLEPIYRNVALNLVSRRSILTRHRKLGFFAPKMPLMLPTEVSSNSTNNLNCRPFTIRTIADCDVNGTRTNDVKSASQTSQAVAVCALTRVDQSLHLGDFQHLIHACNSKKSTNTLSNIQAIVAMFKNETDALPVIHNQQLDKHLRELAIVATSSLAKANHDISSLATT